MHSLSRLHLRPVIVPEQMEQRVDQRPAPGLPHDFWADDRVTELSRESVGHLVPLVDRERKHVSRLVDPQVVALQALDLRGLDEVDPELPLVDPLDGEHALRERDRSLLVDLPPASVVDLDRDHQRLRCVPVSSAWRLYASTIRCTSL